QNAQNLMAQQQIKALLLTNRDDLLYFSGFYTLFWYSQTRPWYMVIPASGDPIAIIPDIGLPVMQKTWVKDIRTWSSPDEKMDGIDFVAECLCEITQDHAQIGLVKGRETSMRMPLCDFDLLKSLIKKRHFVDCMGIIRALRIIKSEAEIDKIAHICQIASTAFDDYANLFNKGQPIADAFRAFKIKLLQLGADDVPYLAGGAGQKGYDDVISLPTDKRLETGDILMLDAGAIYHGYHCDFDRNFAIEKAHDTSKKMHETLYQATEAALNIARPGTSSADLFYAMQHIIQQNSTDQSNIGRMGHGLGIGLTEWPSHIDWDQTILQENMVITLEPSIVINGRMMVHEENLVIRDGYPQLLSKRTQRELPIIK
ncbi:MAG: Xaa-Pro peptidase family protein, partial [Pseudomonadota bacterium]